jgi:hypothetical protein
MINHKADMLNFAKIAMNNRLLLRAVFSIKLAREEKEAVKDSNYRCLPYRALTVGAYCRSSLKTPTRFNISQNELKYMCEYGRGQDH